MTKRFSTLTTAAVLMLGIAGASAAELPTYEIAGLPITPMQMSVLGLSGRTQERPATPTQMHDGMPASPHQIAVLAGPRTQPIEAAASQIGAVTRSE